MKRIEYIYEDGLHRWAVITKPEAGGERVDDGNQYLAVNGRHALLCGAGDEETFPALFSAISCKLDPRQVAAIFVSSQELPSSLSQWLAVNPDLKCHAGWARGGDIQAAGEELRHLNPQADTEIMLGNLVLQALPAHGQAASALFQLYDARARILFSGDIGAALLPEDENGLYVEDFDRHIRYAEDFHKRWMGSDEAKRLWCERVSKMDIDQLCPQHGAIYQGADVMRFINWFAELETRAAGQLAA